VSGPLIGPVELSGLLAGGLGDRDHPDRAPAVLDVRWALGGPPGNDEYLSGHIPGAVFVDLDTDLAGPPGPGGRHPLPTPEVFSRAMRRAGVSAQRPAVVYDATGALAAARAWWLLRYFGHSDVRVLDGGLPAWIAAGLPLETGPAEVAPGDVEARAGAMPLLDAAAAAELARRGVLLDARAPERFRGEQEPIDPVAGHIPGARNAPTAQNLDASGRFLDPEALRRRFVEAGVRPGEPLGAYCGSGVTAAHEVLSLEVAGLPAALYVGSWSEWITDPERPVATGDGPE
jgi:thiosulfate/3-mercaptopyruvate sulfurtransferase